VLYAVKNGGKSTAVASLLRQYKKIKRCHRVFLLSPTAQANGNIWGSLVDPDDIFNSPTQTSLDEILSLVEAEAFEYREYQNNLQAYKQYKEIEQSLALGLTVDVPDDLLLTSIENDFFRGPPKYKYDGFPCLYIVIDDCFASPLFSNATCDNSLPNLATKHRHMYGVGVSIIVTMQAFKSQTGVVSRALRPNIDIVCLYKFKDPKVITGFYEELASSDMKIEDFLNLYQHCTSDAFSFMTLYKGEIRKKWDKILSIQQ
jgi:hypothetical protein